MLSIKTAHHRGSLFLRLSPKRVILVGLCALLLLPILTQLVSAAQSELTITKLDEQRSVNADIDELVAKDNYMYEPDYASGVIEITNVTDPYNPIVTFAHGDYLIYADDIVMIGNTIFVLSSTDDTGSAGRVTAFDITNPNNVNQIGMINITDAGVGCSSATNMFALQSSLLLSSICGAGDYRLLALDVANPAAMVFRDDISFASYDPSIDTVQQIGNFAYVYFRSTYLYARLDISNLNALTFDESVLSAGFGSLVDSRQKVGNYVYAASWTILGGGQYDINLRTIDVSNPASPVNVATMNMCEPISGRDVEFRIASPTRLIAACNEELFDIDITNPLAPVIGAKATTMYSFGYMVLDANNKVYQNSDFENVITEQVYDASTPGAAPTFLGADVNDLAMAYNTYFMIPPGSTTAFVIQQDLPIIRTVDISDPSDMKVLKTQFLTQGGQLLNNFGFDDRSSLSLSADGNFLYIADDSQYDPATIPGQLDVIDISDPDNITVADRLTLTLADNFLTSDVVGDIWYVMNDGNLKTFQINPVDGEITALDSQTYVKPAGANIGYSELAIVNGNAIMTFRVQSVRYMNVSDPSNIGVSATANLPVLSNYRISQPYVTGNHILFAAASSPARLYAVNASNPAAMTISSSITDSIFTNGDGQTIQAYSPNHVLFSSHSGDRFAKLDISNLNSIQIVEQSGAGGLYPDALDGFDTVWDGLAVSGNYAFGASSIADGNLYSFDISNLANPLPLDVISNQVPLWEPQTMHAANGRLYVGSNTNWEVNANLVSYNLTNPDKPVYDGTSVLEFTNITGIVTKNDRLYATRDWGGLGVYDTTNPSFPVLIGLLGDATDPTDIAIDGDMLYIADNNDGLLTYDITDPDNPVLLSTYSDVNFTGLSQIKVNGNYVYGVTNTGPTLVVLDLTNPVTPTTVRTVTDPQFDVLSDIQLEGNRLYVANKQGTGSNGGSLTIYDVSDQSNPQKLGQVVQVQDPGYGSMVVYDEFVMIAARNANRIDIYDVSDPASPVLADSIENDSSLQGVNDLTIVNNRLYSISEFGQSLNTYGLVLGASTGGSTPSTPPATPGGSTPITSVSLANTGESMDTYVRIGLAIIGASGIAYIAASQRQRKLKSAF